jgi:hypothetical protein
MEEKQKDKQDSFGHKNNVIGKMAIQTTTLMVDVHPH